MGTPAPAPSPATPAAPRATPSPPPRPSLADRFFGTPPPKPANPPDGLPRLPGATGSEFRYYYAALLMAIVIGSIIEWIVTAQPVPPGGDSGQWIAASFPYVDRPYPSQVIFFGYPPLVFPILGGLYELGGSAMASGRLFVAVGSVLLGLSTFFLARAMVKRPVIALMIEGFVLLNGPLLRLFFFGGYPTILGIVFMQLSFGFAARWLGSHRPSHLFLTWVTAAATVLSHSLVGALDIATLLFIAAVLLAERALPKQVLFSAAGAAGAAVFAIGVGGYYLTTHLLHILHPNYLSRGALGQTKTNLGSLLYPLRLNALPGIFGHHATFSATAAYGLTIVFAVILFFLIAYLAVRRRLPIPLLMQGSFLLCILAAGAFGWSISIVTDYRRFAYFVYIPIVLGVGWIFDYLLSVFLTLEEGDGDAPGLPPLPPRQPRKGPDPVTVGIAVFGTIGLVVVGAFATVPDWQTYERQYTGDSHGWNFVDAVDAIQRSGLAGSIFTDNGQADRWGRAITDRNTYGPGSPSAFVFYGSQILDYEKANFLVSDVYGVTDGHAIAGISALNGTYFSAVPSYIPMRNGNEYPTLRVLPGSLSVDLGGVGVVPVAFPNQPVVVQFPDPGTADMTLTFVDHAFNFTIAVSPDPRAPGFDFDFSVVATGPHGLRAFHASLAPPVSGVVHAVRGSQSNQTTWSAETRGGAGPIVTFAQLDPGNGTASAFVAAANGAPTMFNFSDSAPPDGAAVSALYANLTISTPGATNLIGNLPPILAGPSILTSWSARYLLLDQAGAAIAAYFTATYGATLLGYYGTWSVFTLPLVYPSEPAGATS